MNNKTLRRSKDGKIGGVAGGIAEFIEIDPVIVRAMFLFLIFFGGVGIVLYLILLIIMPTASTETEQAETIDYEIINEHQQAKKAINNKQTGSAIVGICLIFIGLLFLLRLIIPYFWCRLYLPALLIFAGILFLIVPLFTKTKK